MIKHAKYFLTLLEAASSLLISCYSLWFVLLFVWWLYRFFFFFYILNTNRLINNNRQYTLEYYLMFKMMSEKKFLYWLLLIIWIYKSTINVNVSSANNNRLERLSSFVLVMQVMLPYKWNVWHVCSLLFLKSNP